MKKLLLSLGLVCAIYSLSGQTHEDALRYSQQITGTTARSMSMGGAFGSLGGDFSTLSTNPAGIAVYRGSELTFTPELYFSGTNTRYYQKEIEEDKFNFNLNNFGFVACFKLDGSMLKSINFGGGYNKIANFERRTIITGDNPFTTYSDYMAADANEFGLEDTYSRYTSALFYDAYLIDTFNNGYVINNDYLYNDGSFRTTEQYFGTDEYGKINEWVFSLGFNINDIFFFGGTFGIQPLTYGFDKTTKEFDASNRAYQYFDFSESLDVTGTGYTGKFGVIVKPIQALRLGAAFHLPVTYHLRERYSTSIRSGYTDPQWITYYPIDLDGYDLDYLENNYHIITPAKAIFSAGLVLGKFLVLSSDLEYIDYSSMRMSSSVDDYSDENELIKEVYTDNFNFKMGGELRFGTLYLRGGGGFYGSPFKDTEANSDADKYSLSCGFGIRDKIFFIDFAYQYFYSEERTYMYGANDGEGIWRDNPASITSQTNRVLTTIGFRF